MSNGSRTPAEQQRPGQETAQPSAPDFLLEQHPLLPSLPHVGHGARHRLGPLAGRLGLAHPGRLLLRHLRSSFSKASSAKTSQLVPHGGGRQDIKNRRIDVKKSFTNFSLQMLDGNLVSYVSTKFKAPATDDQRSIFYKRQPDFAQETA